MTAGESWPYGCPFYGIRYEEALISIQDSDDDDGWPWVDRAYIYSVIDSFAWRNAIGHHFHYWIDLDGTTHRNPLA